MNTIRISNLFSAHIQSNFGEHNKETMFDRMKFEGITILKLLMVMSSDCENLR